MCVPDACGCLWPSTTTRNALAFCLVIVSFVLLFPGLTLPFLTVDASIKILLFRKTILHQRRSVVSTIVQLYHHGHPTVACLITLFSVVVPIVKGHFCSASSSEVTRRAGCLLLAVMCIRSPVIKHRIHRLVDLIGKWSMADVFAVGVVVAMLSLQAAENITAHFELGFYYFVCYCIVSLLAVQLLYVPDRHGTSTETENSALRREARNATDSSALARDPFRAMKVV